MPETSTDKTANVFPTVSSTAADINGMAVIDACSQINERLAKVKAGLPADAPFATVCEAAWFQRCALTLSADTHADPHTRSARRPGSSVSTSAPTASTRRPTCTSTGTR